MLVGCEMCTTNAGAGCKEGLRDGCGVRHQCRRVLLAR